MLVGYGRVSTDSQSTATQVDALMKAGCERIFEESISGRKEDRPQLTAALEFMRQGDTLVVVALSRLARTMSQLLFTIEDLQARGIEVRSLAENIDTGSATGRLILHIFGALGEFEVSLLRERTKAALIARRKMGKVGGRPRSIDDAKLRAATAMMSSGNLTAIEIAKQVGVSPSTLYRYLPGGRSAAASTVKTNG